MAKTIIDALVYELGLDPKNFKKGEKEAVESLRNLEKQGKKTGEGISESVDKGSSSIMALGKRVLTVAAIFKVLSYTTKNILEASRATYDLGNASRYLGESARSLRNFENIAEIMGGTAEGARKSVQGLKQSLFDLSFNGQVSNNLRWISRLGVATQGRGGKPRDFGDVYMDTADALQKNISSGKMTESEALMSAESAGFDPGLARSMIGGRDAARLALAHQEARRQVSPEDVAAATANEQAITSAGQAKDTAFTAAQTKTSGFITGTARSLEGAWAAGATGDIGAAWENLIEPVTKGLGDLADATRSATATLWGMARTAALGKGPEAYRGAVLSSARAHGVPAEILAGVLGAESDWDPKAVSPAGARGIAQLMPAYFPGAGVNPVDDIDTAAKYLAQLHGSFTKTGSNDADAWDKALMSYNGGERRLRTSPVFGDGSSGKSLDSETVNYPGRVYDAAAQWREGMGGTGGTTTVDIGEINVVTSATDANGIASSIGDATRRKLTAAQAPSQGPQ